MYFSPALIAVAASFVTLGLAVDPLSFNSWPTEPLQAGKPITLTWSGGDPYTVRSHSPAASLIKAKIIPARDDYAP